MAGGGIGGTGGIGGPRPSGPLEEMEGTGACKTPAAGAGAAEPGAPAGPARDLSQGRAPWASKRIQEQQILMLLGQIAGESPAEVEEFQELSAQDLEQIESIVATLAEILEKLLGLGEEGLTSGADGAPASPAGPFAPAAPGTPAAAGSPAPSGSPPARPGMERPGTQRPGMQRPEPRPPAGGPPAPRPSGAGSPPPMRPAPPMPGGPRPGAPKPVAPKPPAAPTGGASPAVGLDDDRRARYVETRVTNGPADRSPQGYVDAIEQFGVERSKRYQPRQRTDPNTGETKTDTFCNIFVWDVTRAMGVEIPHWVDKDGNPAAPGQKGAHEMNANESTRWMRKHGAEQGWLRVSPEVAQAAANGGVPSMYIKERPEGRSGHMGIVRPGEFDAGKGPAAAQAGSNPNYSNGNVGREYKTFDYYINPRDLTPAQISRLPPEVQAQIAGASR